MSKHLLQSCSVNHKNLTHSSYVDRWGKTDMTEVIRGSFYNFLFGIRPPPPSHKKKLIIPPGVCIWHSNLDLTGGDLISASSWGNENQNFRGLYDSCLVNAVCIVSLGKMATVLFWHTPFLVICNSGVSLNNKGWETMCLGKYICILERWN